MFIFSTLLFYSNAVFSADCELVSLLKVGSKGSEVQCLQGKVGAAMDGSFGPLTRAAVVAFQSSHGLVPDGIVGPLSRSALNNITLSGSSGGVSAINPLEGCISTLEYSPKTGIKCDSLINPTPAGPSTSTTPPPGSTNSTTTNTAKVSANLVNLDQFIAKVVEVNRKSGMSESDIERMVEVLKNEAINSNIDLNKTFKELLISESQLSLDSDAKPSSNFFDKIIAETLSFLGIKPSTAHATSGIPFGGALIYSFFCAYNGSWMLGIEPFPPSFAVLLTYYPGTQGFASYNIPFTTWLLGEYVTPGVCMIPGTPVYSIPTEGTITPLVGSSPS